MENDKINYRLRKKAEELLQSQNILIKSEYKDVDEVIYELHVHQIELEMQNEELRESQLKLEDSRREYFDLYNFAPVGYLTLDKDGIILKVNLTGATLLGVDRIELHKRALIQFIDPEYRNIFQHHITGFLNNGTKESVELKLIKKDKCSFYANLETIIVQDDDGNFKEFRIVLTDISEKIEAKEVLLRSIENYKASNNDLKQFAYVSSHDLREPLRMITTFLQLLKRKYKNQLDQDANDYINFAVDGAKRLDIMIMDLLEYSNVARKEQKNLPVNFERVVDEALKNLKGQIEKNNAIVTYDPLPIINGDEKLKIQLFQNLISNAIKYRSQNTPRIHISATKELNQYLFSVKDNGIGIDSEHLNRIFTIFQRLHGRDEYEGTGIGLSIVEKIIQKSGGHIWAESELGKGTTFYFTIPILE
jgi:two-component system, chemotaxis family, sensor kinase Cph1